MATHGLLQRPPSVVGAGVVHGEWGLLTSAADVAHAQPHEQNAPRVTRPSAGVRPLLRPELP